VLSPPYQGGNTLPNPVPDPGTVPDPGAKGRKEKGVVKGQEKTPKKSEPVIAEILTEMKAFLGYPQKTEKDPIPNYAKEGQFLKKMLGRHFTREEILSCWKSKVRQRRGEYVSLAWVNEDIAAYVHRREGESPPQSGSVGNEAEGIAAMQAAGWDTGGEET